MVFPHSCPIQFVGQQFCHIFGWKSNNSIMTARCNVKNSLVRVFPNDAATYWLFDSVRFSSETFTDTTLWNFFSIGIETFILRAFQNLPILDQLSILIGPMVAYRIVQFWASGFCFVCHHNTEKCRNSKNSKRSRSLPNGEFRYHRFCLPLFPWDKLEVSTVFGCGFRLWRVYR